MNMKHGETSFWLWLCPRYGLFGGASWTGGKFVRTFAEEQEQYKVKSQDDMDELFKVHDVEFTLAIRNDSLYDRWVGMIAANAYLLWGLICLGLLHHLWDRQPVNIVWSYCYRILGIIGMVLFLFGLCVLYPFMLIFRKNC